VVEVLEHLSSACQNLVQRFPKEPGGLGDVAADLLGVLLPALPDLLLEELLEVAVPDSLLPLGRMVHHDVGDERPSEAPGLERRVL
jgi:hypothetical protein